MKEVMIKVEDLWANNQPMSVFQVWFSFICKRQKYKAFCWCMKTIETSRMGLMFHLSHLNNIL